MSHATAKKRESNRGYRRALSHSPFWRVFTSLLPVTDRAAWEAAINPSQDLGSIGAQAQPSGYVALVYADGDRVGRALRRVVRQHGFSGYQQLSEALTAAATEATARALATTYGHRPPSSTLPFEVITIGGDDILLICTAGSGLPVASALGRFFGEAITAELGRRQISLAQPMTASVGVVIAHDAMPVLALERAGRELLKSAKDAAAPGALDFHIVTTPGLDRIDRIRALEYQTTKDAVLTKRPYALADAETLVRHARAIRGHRSSPGSLPASAPPGTSTGVPGTKIAELYRSCRGDRKLATLNVLGLQARLEPAPRRALTQALGDLGSVASYPFSAPDASGRSHTALLDLLEASEFVTETWGQE